MLISCWQEHKTRLRSYIARRVREHDAVDDILQEVFLKAHTSLHTLKSPGSITAWLYRIAAKCHCRSLPFATFVACPPRRIGHP